MEIGFKLAVKNTETVENIKLSLLSYGNESCSPDKRCVYANRPRYIMHFIVYGKGRFQYGNEQKVTLSRGDAFLLYANESYAYHPDSSNPWTYAWLTLDGENLEELFSECGFSKEKPYLRLNNFNSFVSDVKKVTEAYGEGLTYEGERSAYLLLILSRLIRQNDMRRNIEETKLQKRRSFRNAVAYIRDNYSLELDCLKIASYVFLSESYLRHLFREMIGMSIIDYLNRYRISQACLLMQRDGDLNDREIARRVGFENYTYFVKTFKKYCGMGSREYKKSGMKDDPFAWLRDNLTSVFNKEEIDWL